MKELNIVVTKNDDTEERFFTSCAPRIFTSGLEIMLIDSNTKEEFKITIPRENFRYAHVFYLGKLVTRIIGLGLGMEGNYIC